MATLFISNSNFGPGLSGGDRIFLELLRRWSKKQSVSLMGAGDTLKLLSQYRLRQINFIKVDNSNRHITPTVLNIIKLQITRTCKSIYFIFKHYSYFRQFTHIYSVSDFYADLLPAFILKIIFPKITWIAGYYLLAPKPFSEDSPYRNQPVRGLIYYLSQILSLNLVRIKADYVFVTSDPDIKYFLSSRIGAKNIIVVRGGVNISAPKNFFKKHTLLPFTSRKYQACFIGRLHPQKGVLILIDIWKIVTNSIPDAKLAIIGNGSLHSALSSKIRRLHLSKNIDVLGFLDGSAKNNIFKNSALVVHPATYDSGGMASAEAMSWGLPGISFDLEALKTYYPQGMVKIRCFDTRGFAAAIIKLLSSTSQYRRYSRQAHKLIFNQWDWDKRADTIYHQVFL